MIIGKDSAITAITYMFSFFSYPYPASSLRSRLVSLVTISIFVIVFLAWFQPFGLARIPPVQLLLVCSSYGAVTAICIALVLLASPPFLPRFFDELRWTIGREFIVTVIIFLLVGIANMFLSAWYGFFPFNFGTLLYFQIITLSVGIFPLAVLIGMKYRVLNARHGREATEITQLLGTAEHYAALPVQVITFHSAADSTIVSIPPPQLLFIAAAQNYIEIWWHDSNGIHTKLLRNTLRSAETECMASPTILRCHRSYIVNIENVVSVKGNARGLILSLRDCPEIVPVSRSFIPIVEQCFSSLT